MKTFRVVLCGVTAALFPGNPAVAADEFPFGKEMTLDARPQRGSKRLPNLEIGDRGEVVLQLWCKTGKAQFSVAGDTIVFVPGPLDESGCNADQAQLDDALLATLSDATNWRRQGDIVSFAGAKTVKFRINTN